MADGPRIAFRGWVIGGCLCAHGFRVSFGLAFRMLDNAASGPSKPLATDLLLGYSCVLVLACLGPAFLLWAKIGNGLIANAPQGGTGTAWKNPKWFIVLAVAYFLFSQLALAMDTGWVQSLFS